MSSNQRIYGTNICSNAFIVFPAELLNKEMTYIEYFAIKDEKDVTTGYHSIQSYCVANPNRKPIKSGDKFIFGVQLSISDYTAEMAKYSAIITGASLQVKIDEDGAVDTVSIQSYEKLKTDTMAKLEEVKEK